MLNFITQLLQRKDSTVNEVRRYAIIGKSYMIHTFPPFALAKINIIFRKHTCFFSADEAQCQHTRVLLIKQQRQLRLTAAIFGAGFKQNQVKGRIGSFF